MSPILNLSFLTIGYILSKLLIENMPAYKSPISVQSQTAVSSFSVKQI